MRKEYLVQIASVFEDGGFNPISDFAKKSTGDRVVFTYNKEPRLFFEIEEHPTSDRNFDVQYSKFDKTFSVIKPSHYYNYLITIVLDEVRKWLEYQIKAFMKEEETLDPWDTYNFSPPYELLSGAGINSINFESNDAFTHSEQKVVKEVLEEAKTYLNRNLSLESGAVKILSDKLDELIDATEKLGKKDWRDFAWEVVTGATIAVATNVELFQEDRWPFYLPYFIYISPDWPIPAIKSIKNYKKSPTAKLMGDSH